MLSSFSTLLPKSRFHDFSFVRTRDRLIPISPFIHSFFFLSERITFCLSENSDGNLSVVPSSSAIRCRQYLRFRSPFINWKISHCTFRRINILTLFTFTKFIFTNARSAFEATIQTFCVYFSPFSLWQKGQTPRIAFFFCDKEKESDFFSLFCFCLFRCAALISHSQSHSHRLSIVGKWIGDDCVQ